MQKVTDASGLAVFDGLVVGTYKVSVPEVPPQFRLPEPQTVAVAEGDNEVFFRLDFRTGTLRVSVVDPSGAPVAGAVVSVEVT